MYKDGPTFAVVRNPYSRVVSEYNYRCRCGRLETPSEAGFNAFVAETLNKSTESLKLEFDCHLLPQCNYLWNRDGSANTTDIARFEHLDRDLARIGTKYDLEFLQRPIPAKNQSPKAVSSRDLNRLSIQLINRCYLCDFQKLGYATAPTRTTSLRLR